MTILGGLYLEGLMHGGAYFRNFFLRYSSSITWSCFFNGWSRCRVRPCAGSLSRYTYTTVFTVKKWPLNENIFHYSEMLKVSWVWSSGCTQSWRGLLLTVTDVSTTCAVVIFRVKVSCIMSVDGIILWLLIWLVNYVAMLLVVCQLSRDVIGYEDS